MNNIKKYSSVTITLIFLLINIINGEQININFQNDYTMLSNINLNNTVEIPEGFVLVDENNPFGPITVNREKDNGNKRNLFNIVNKQEDDSFYYKYDEFKLLENELPQKSEYICELKENYHRRVEVQKGYDISCPLYYTIVIDKVFYGRYANDTTNCTKYTNFDIKNMLKIKNDCGYEPLKEVKELCEGKNYCSIIACNVFYNDECKGIYKYLNVKYHCKKDLELRKEKIAIVSFYNGINVNTLEENSVSEFYQYSKIHGYDFFFSMHNYMPSRQIYFMKFNVIIEKIIEGLKTKKYDWIFWTDNDTIITNPNIKLETFLPNENMNKIHLIAAYDYLGRRDFCCGLNTGVFFIRVHEWSLNLLMRAMSYPYFNYRKSLSLPEQISLTNTLIEFNEYNHYVIVPHQWFNEIGGKFISHLMGKDQKIPCKINIINCINNIKYNQYLYNRTNDDLRKEVLEYYNLPSENQIKIKMQP